MALEQKEKKTWFQRIRQLILGKERPNFITRVSVGVGFLLWIYMASWHILTLMSLTLMGSLKQAELIEGSFNRVGSKLYGFSDTVNRLYVYSFIELISFAAILVGLILIYRKKRLGFLLYIIGSVLTVLTTIFVLGLKYFQHENTYTDLGITIIATAYFGLGALWFYKWKPSRKKENEMSQNPA